MGNIIYFIVMLIAIILARKAEKKNKKKYLKLIVFMVSILSGFRGLNVGIDTKLYNYAFLNNFPYAWQFEELGFRAISTFVLNIFNDTRAVFLFFALIINGCIIYRLWDFKDKCSFTVMLLIYLLTFYVDSMNIMRQMVAVAIIFLSTRLLEKKHYSMFLIVIMGTTFIHVSSLLAVALIIAYYWIPLKLSNKILIAIPMIILEIVFLLVIIQFESGHINNYLSEQNSVSNINIPFLYRFLCFLLSYMIYKSNIKFVINRKKEPNINIKDDLIVYDEFFRIISFIYLMGLLISSLGMFFTVMARLGYFYILFEVVYWGYLAKTSRNKELNIVMIMIYVGYIFLVEIFSSGCEVFPFYLNI